MNGSSSKISNFIKSYQLLIYRVDGKARYVQRHNDVDNVAHEFGACYLHAGPLQVVNPI